MDNPDKFTIGLIDDDDAEIITFEKVYGEYFNFYIIDEEEKIEDMISKIREGFIDCLFIDHKLRNFHGAELFNSIQERFYLFPVILFTRYVNDAKIEISDPFLLKDKRLYLNVKAKDEKHVKTFVEYLKFKVDFYKKKFNDYKNELSKLLKIRKERKFLPEEKFKVLHLDTKLEEMIDREHSIPLCIKEKVYNDDKILDLINKANKIIEAFRQSNE